MKPVRPIFFGGIIARFLFGEDNQPSHNVQKYLREVATALQAMTKDLPSQWCAESADFYDRVRGVSLGVGNLDPMPGTSAIVRVM